MSELGDVIDMQGFLAKCDGCMRLFQGDDLYCRPEETSHGPYLCDSCFKDRDNDDMFLRGVPFLGDFDE
jgi:hypothetical protein